MAQDKPRISPNIPVQQILTSNKKNKTSSITFVKYNKSIYDAIPIENIDKFLEMSVEPDALTWLCVEGLSDRKTLRKIGRHYKLHPLTIDDIVPHNQRPKVEEFDDYVFITMQLILWNITTKSYTTEQLGLVLGRNFVLSFQETENNLFDVLIERMRSDPNQPIRQHGSDFLVYRIMDLVVDQYFFVLEGLGNQIEKVEDRIFKSDRQKNFRSLYKIKRQLAVLRKAIWPMREVASHLTQPNEFISTYTRVYLRDVYDHAVQAIDMLETYRDMLSGLLDVYVSKVSTRMNEIVKVLTIITTIFIPMTFISSIYGMNFKNMPELNWQYGYPITLGLMFIVGASMLIYFWRKRWF